MERGVASRGLFIGDIVDIVDGKVDYRDDSRPLFEQNDVYDFYVVGHNAEKGEIVAVYEAKELAKPITIAL